MVLIYHILKLQRGKTYYVTLNGIEYECVAWSIPEDPEDYAVIGNGSIWDYELGEDVPFIISSGYYYCYLGVEEEGSYTIKINAFMLDHHIIPEEYLPPIIGKKGTGLHSEIFNADYNHASGNSSHAEGDATTASGDYSHAEGWFTTASGESSHAEGSNTTASNYASHAEGSWTTASGHSSHAEGINTIAAGKNQHVQGKYNIEDTEDKYAILQVMVLLLFVPTLILQTGKAMHGSLAMFIQVVLNKMILLLLVL